MQEKEVDNPLLISNFEVYKSRNKVVLYINSKIFPISIINKTASLFKEKAWVAIDGNEDEILVELKPKQEIDLELLAREFNNELLKQSTKDINVGIKSNALLSKIKEVVAEFVREEQGRISKQSILTIGTILTTLGLAEIVSASHACPPPVDSGPVYDQGAGGCEGGGGGDGGGGCGSG